MAALSLAELGHRAGKSEKPAQMEKMLDRERERRMGFRLMIMPHNLSRIIVSLTTP